MLIHVRGRRRPQRKVTAGRCEREIPRRAAAVVLLLVFLLGCPEPPPPPPPPPSSGARVVNMIPAALSGETFQDSEPFLAVHPSNPQLMAASAFTPNPFGSASGTAPIFVSQDGGNTWTLNNIVPSQLLTGDITHAFDSGGGGGDLYGGILRRPGTLLLNELVTANFLAPAVMTVLASRTDPDQPFVRATTASGADRVYVANNDLAVSTFRGGNGRTATVDVSTDGGATWRSVRIETRGTSGQDGPSVRTAIAGDGTVYAAYFGWRSFAGGIATSDVVVTRDDNGAAGATPFGDLLDPADGLAGRFVVQNVRIPFSNSPTLGQERIGSSLSIAVDPNNSAIVYIAWADRVGSGDVYTVHLRRSTDRGVTWSAADLRTITNATNPSVAIAGNGTVGFLYQAVVGGRWETRLEQSRDGFATRQDDLLASVPSNTPTVQFLPYIGDYNFLLAVGNEFRGVFSANNAPVAGNFPPGIVYQRSANFSNGTLDDGAGNAVSVSIDPFFFSIAAIP